jgi:hypothetical protein
LEATITVPMSPDQIAEYEYIRQKRLEGIELADLKCRKGNVPFSAKYQNLTARIELWKAVKKKTLQIQSKQT